MKQPPVHAADVPAVLGQTIYPAPFASQVKGRYRRRLGELFGLGNFGVNLTDLAPGTCSALAHHHTKQDEFIYVVEGSLVLLLDGEAFTLESGDCYGFKAGDGVAHQLVNRSGAPVRYLEIGDRSAGDRVEYPFDDLLLREKTGGGYDLRHKDGRPY